MIYEFKLPDLGEGLVEAEIVKWLVKEGDYVKKDQNIVEVETAKALVEIPSPVEGKIVKLIGLPGKVVKVGEVLVVFETAEKIEKKIEEKGTFAVGELPKEEIILPKPLEAIAMPAARELAKKLGVDLSKVKGSGPGSVITEADVKNYYEALKAPKAPRLVFEHWGKALRIPYRGTRKTIGENMLLSKRTIPHVTHMDVCDVTELSKLRAKYKLKTLKEGFPLTYLPFVIKACYFALKANPYFNSSLDEENKEIVVKQYYNIGFAVDTSEGLLVPVVKEVDKKSIFQIAKEIKEFSDLARERKLKIEDMQGGTFTITNIGSIGGTYSTPIIRWPECAILALGRIYKDLSGRDVLPLSLSFDHRIIDGARAARFLNDVKSYLENVKKLKEYLI